MEVLISGGLERHRKPGDYVNEASYTRNKTKSIEVVFKERRMYDIIFSCKIRLFCSSIKTFRVINCSVKLILVGCRGAAANQKISWRSFPGSLFKSPKRRIVSGACMKRVPRSRPPLQTYLTLNPSQPLPLKHPTSVQIYTDLPSFQVKLHIPVQVENDYAGAETPHA